MKVRNKLSTCLVAKLPWELSQCWFLIHASCVIIGFTNYTTPVNTIFFMIHTNYFYYQWENYKCDWKILLSIQGHYKWQRTKSKHFWHGWTSGILWGMAYNILLMLHINEQGAMHGVKVININKIWSRWLSDSQW